MATRSDPFAQKRRPDQARALRVQTRDEQIGGVVPALKMRLKRELRNREIGGDRDAGYRGEPGCIHGQRRYGGGRKQRKTTGADRQGNGTCWPPSNVEYATVYGGVV